MRGSAYTRVALPARLGEDGDFFESTPREVKRAIPHRFVAGATLGRFHAVNRRRLGGMMTTDIAFPRNERQWFETPPPDISSATRPIGITS